LALIFLNSLIWGYANPSISQTPIRLQIASWEGPEGTNMPALRAWAKELEEKGKGRIKAEIVYGGAMGKTTEHYDLAVTGVADVAYVGLPFTPGRFPMAEVMDLPINTGAVSDETLCMAFLELYNRGYFDNDFKDVKVCFFITVSPYDYQMTKAQILTFDDMKGKKMRVTGKVHSAIVAAFGSVPVGLPGSEIYSALEKGITDGVFTCWSAVPTWRYEKLLKHVTETGICGMGFAVVMSKATYAKLPKDIQSLIDEIRPKYTRLAGHNTELKDQEGKKITIAAGGQVHKFSDADMKKMENILNPFWTDWIAEGKTKGLPREKMFKDLYDIMKGMGVDVPFRGYKP
jgi:TRAP-type C4-dicarboxylate transport system substrate-binding protein